MGLVIFRLQSLLARNKGKLSFRARFSNQNDGDFFTSSDVGWPHNSVNMREYMTTHRITDRQMDQQSLGSELKKKTKNADPFFSKILDPLVPRKHCRPCGAKVDNAFRGVTIYRAIP